MYQLCGLLDNASTIKKNSTLIGFILPKMQKKIFSECTVTAASPSALLFKNNNKFNEYHMQSWGCFIRCDADSSDVSVCASCRIFWRNFRGLQPNKTVLLGEHYKSLKKVQKVLKNRNNKTEN